MNIKRIGIGLLGVFFSGCMVTTTTQVVEVDRVDQEITSNVNRGYLMGTPPKGEIQQRKATRQVIRTDIELPTLSELEKAPTKDQDSEGNRGYLIQGEALPKATPSAAKVVEVVEEEPETNQNLELTIPPTAETIESFTQQAVNELEPQPSLPWMEEYVIQKGDTLQSIAAKQDIYGRASQWVKLYKANKDVIKDPNRVFPGTKIRIPRD